MDYQTVGNVAEKLLDYVENGGTFQSDRIMTVPSAHYTDPERWAREMELIFKRVPLMLALSAELPDPGSYKAMEVMGTPLLITRDSKREVRAFLNVCQHRGAPLTTDCSGNRSRFTCTYHGWTYANDGRLLSVTDQKNFGDIDKSKRSLSQLPCVERAGMIFVGLNRSAKLDVESYYAGILKDFETADLANWTFLGSRTIEGANWKIAFDGYLEGYHFATLHPTSIAVRTPTNVTHYESFGPHMRIGFPQKDIAKLRDTPRAQWGNRENSGFDFVRILFPNISAFLAPEIAQIAQLFPGPTPETNRTVLLYARRNAPVDDADRAEVAKMIDFLRDVTYCDDYLLGNRIQQGLKSGGVENLVFGKNERGNQFFHEVVEWYLRDDPSLPLPVM